MVTIGSGGVSRIAAGAAALAVIGGGVGYLVIRDGSPGEVPAQEQVDDDDAAADDGADAAADDDAAAGDTANTDDAAAGDQTQEGDATETIDSADEEPLAIELDFTEMVSADGHASLVDDGLSVKLVHLLETGTAWDGNRCLVMLVRESPQQITGFRNGTSPAACTPAETAADTWHDLEELSRQVTDRSDRAARLLGHPELDTLLGDGQSQEVAFAEIIDGGGDPPTQPTQRFPSPVVELRGMVVIGAAGNRYGGEMP